VKLQFLGATRQVTGSKYCLEAGGTKTLVDCGMFQEREYRDRNWEPSSKWAKDLDAVVLTHAHLDHCGLTPRLVKDGFSGPIFSTPASADLVEIILRDSAEIQVEDAAYKRRRHKKEGRKGRHPEVPLYETADVERTLPLVKAVPYGQAAKINGDVRVTFHDAGHILGSAVVEVAVGQGDRLKRVLFSGDLGQWDRPLIRDPTVFRQADFVVMESTYGNRDHDDHESIESQLARLVSETVQNGGNVVIPTFALERAQELMFYISRLVRHDRIPNVPVFLDSPMAVDVTDVFRRHRECYDEQTWQMRARVQGDQRAEGAGHHHGLLRDVHRRPHQVPPATQHHPAGEHDPVRGLPGPRHAGAPDPGRERRGSHPRAPVAGARPGG